MRIVPTTKSTPVTLSDLRPDAIDEKVRAACAKDVEFLVRNSGMFESRACPACTSQDFRPFCTKDGFQFVECVACLSILMNPAPSSDLLQRFYDQSENYKVWGSFVYPLTQETRWNSLHKRRAEKIRRAIFDYLPEELGWHVNGLNYLELGAGTGDTADRFRFDSPDLNLNVGVVEINPTMLSILSDRSIDAFELEEVKEESQHVIAAFEVLEHLIDPTEMLRTALLKLAPGGLFIFSTPNSMSLEVQMLKQDSSTLDQEHISVLSLTGLAIAATRLGFNVRRLEATGELDLELIFKARGVSDGTPMLSEALAWGSQNDISRANLSSNCTGVFQKRL
jgi:ubiquinone/menaquinone biosynthesis C-methylase UbiE